MSGIEVFSSQNETSQPAEHIQVSSSWCGPGPAAYDFRTDTITTPTLSMLKAIAQTTLMDDVYQEDSTTNDFEKFMANLTGKEDSLLVMSGTMGNQIALRSLLTQPPHAILCHYQSHILKSEAGGCSSLSQAHMQPCIPANGQYLTLEDIQRDVDTRDNIHIAPTRVISLENTLAGVITPLEEVRRISAFARANNIKMHLDGARIWEAVAAGAGSLVEYLDCFDTAQMCFSKGLAAPVGSIIVGPKSTLQHCRWVRKSIGGGIRQAGIISSAARVAVEENFGKGPNGEGGRLRETHKKAKCIEKMWVDRGGAISRPVDTNMVCLDLPSSGITVERAINVGKEEGVKLFGGRIVVHCQIVDDAVVRLENVFDRLLSSTEKREVIVNESESVYR
ncbi:Aromatic amino acid beta-eliminating lyase/threonine aldolase [Penicillium expansum]|uniref:Aromatic amino acid beta-eliminating lyase/threonine aldolase n=1 Tax=Penicillium expansum TaxID=27334 RepID=A0A0A2JQB2_PENEN|nr:Aromatic amino acid beta-eliminating lyase/threonine aldolase [Penicillium expansum]KAJ5501580.1 Aromatic amino acid beta-eliminating lyase/threonine aldolase [Penicillium expansum]KGO40011.1 Aromatic amino acid beta-eliminating lyase/threonine aldolase [Penicillium expansum]KGO53225.1 Aromatic amino acid beta-eliminating lyase/threonine aldolase [Penicillium expansum]KGO56823.1 Aromatic amino acid beta-eliminating lyase/threonine aldolase [Penicillium expansum]